MAALVPQAWATPLLLAGGQNTGEQRDLRMVLDDLSRHRALVIDLQRELISRPAVEPESGGGGEDAKARWLESWLTGHGVYHERLDFPDERVSSKVRPNIVAVYPDRQAGRTLWLLSHLDVAAGGNRELWNGDPFALRVEGDVMYGRGVEDNNQAITTSLLVLESLRKTGVVPPMRLGLVFTSGAITDCDIGIGHVLAEKPELFSPDDLILVMDDGNAKGNLVSVGEKGNLWLKITVLGKWGHAGAPNKAINAYEAAAALTHDLHDLEREFPVENPIFSPPHTTFTATRTEDFSTGINHIPDKFVFYTYISVLAEYSFESVEKAVRGMADEVEKSYGVRVEIERVKKTPPSLVTPSDAPVLAVLDRAIRVQLGVEPKHVGSAHVTAAAALREKGLAAAVWGVHETMHCCPEEYALISAHITQAQVLARMLFDEPFANAENFGGGKNGKAAEN